MKNVRLLVVRSGYFLVFYSLCMPTHAQIQPEQVMGKVNIHTPNAAALGKYIDFPVSYHTGVPNIEVPLYTVTDGSLSLPISLSYHAGGLKVEENASWVGAGWTLNAGGAIMRTVKDKPDEKQTSSLQQTYGHYSNYGMQSYWELSNPQHSNVDYEPDLFFFNFNGYSGKFMFNDDRSVVLIPEQDIHIQCSYEEGLWTESPGAKSGLGNCIEQFIVTTPDGVKYYFGINQMYRGPIDEQPIEVNNNVSAENSVNLSQVITSWFLYKIVSPDGGSSIELKYTREKYGFFTYYQPIKDIFGSAQTTGPQDYQKIKNLVSGVRLKSIVSSHAAIYFISPEINARQDLSRWQIGLDESLVDELNSTRINGNFEYAAGSLGRIEIKSTENENIKNFEFSYDYFEDNVTQLHASLSGINSDRKRLKLLSVKEVSGDNTIGLPPITFSYHSGLVSRKLSFGKDHWGFMNGANNNENLYPEILDNTGHNVTGRTPSNRESNYTAMIAGVLKKIQYSTGGYTEFEFEANSVPIEIPNTQQLEDKIVGGLRIKKIIHSDPLTSNSTETEYKYQLQESPSLSSGVLFGKPVYGQLVRNDFFKDTYGPGKFYGGLNGCLDFVSDNEVTGRGFVYSDNPLRPLEETQGNHIGYSRIEVNKKDGSYSVFRFNTLAYPEIPDFKEVAVTKINSPGTCDLTIPNYPPAPLPYRFARGLLQSESQYTSEGKLVLSKEYAYHFQQSPISIPGRIVLILSNIWVYNTLYGIITGRKTYTSTTSRTPDPNDQANILETTQEEFYESPNHLMPTKINTLSSENKLITKKLKYSKDFVTPSMAANISLGTYYNAGAGNFMTLYNNMLANYSNAFSNCYDQFCGESINNDLMSAIFTDRAQFVNNRRQVYTDEANSYDQALQSSRDDASDDLKSILWLQTNHRIVPVEITQWRDGKLLSAQYTQFNNLRNDALGVYPEKSQQVNLATPLVVGQFIESALNTTGNAIITDSRYEDEIFVSYNKGNVISATDRADIISSYAWGYKNSFPVVKTINATNQNKEQVVSGIVNAVSNLDIILNSGNSTYESTSKESLFTQTQTRDIVVNFPSTTLPNGYTKIEVSCTLGNLSGTGSQESKIICISNNNSCGSTANSCIFQNKPAANYKLTLSAVAYYSSGGFPLYSYPVNYTFYGNTIQTIGLKEFFSENFEENTLPNVTTGNAHTGNKLWNSGSYTVSFTKPNSRDYIIQWWARNMVNWEFHQETYTGSKTLTGPIDDVRIFPSDAQMTTYTYDPLRGMTSEMDLNGRTIYYDYDVLGRLLYVRDKDGNIIKKYEYQYQQSGIPLGICNTTNCIGNDKKCINSFCERGRRINTSTVLMLNGVNQGQWKCIYHYEFSDGSRYPASGNLIDFGGAPCDVMQ